MSMSDSPPVTPPPAITTASFTGKPFPPDVASRILSLLVAGSPFASALTRFPTNRGSVAFPTARPDRPEWIGEMQDIPIVGLGDDAALVGVCKLASILLMSNESVFDASINLTTELTNLLRDSASAELDRGLLYGTGAPEPEGAVTAATEAAGADLAAALTAAIGDIGDNGGTVTHVAARPSVLATARNARDDGGQFTYPAGIGAALGVTEVPVPQLEAGDVLAFDASRCFLVVSRDFMVDTSQDFAFQQDALATRIRGRFAVAVPDMGKGMRRLSIGD